ncbi:Hypothetical protein D9617_4g004200 [Elsinoe fawcettii]|nr:Hypothetical protein D9617_4g004200 [Elsinoe fawcettii]
MAAPQRFWTDHDYNLVRGATLTTDVETGRFILTSLTTLVGLAGTAAWTITAYAIFHLRIKEHPIDTIRFQEQIVLRNPTSPLADSWSLLRMIRSWSTHPGIRLSTILLVCLAVSIWASFAFASIAVAYVAVPSYKISRVLLAPSRSGLPRFSSTIGGAFAQAYKIANDTAVARNYAQQCYHNVSGPRACSFLPVQALDYTKGLVPCPWSGDRCVTGEAYRLESVWLDSHRHLGINAVPKDRVQVRLLCTCSVIRYADLRTIVPDRTTGNRSELHQYKLGIVPGVQNYTFQYSTHTPNDLVSYTLNAAYSRAGISTGMQVVPSLQQEDADLSFVLFAQNSVQYTGPTLDPMFSASGAITTSGGRIGPDSWAHIVVCMDQKQARNPITNATTRIAGYAQLDGAALALNTAQNATLSRLHAHLFASDTYNTVAGQNGAALLASSKLWQFSSPPLPDTQWQLEVEGWFETGLAKLQHATVDFVANKWASERSSVEVEPVATVSSFHSKDEFSRALHRQAHSQIARNLAGYQSFIVVGMVIAIIGSGLLLVLSCTMGMVVKRMSKCTRLARSDSAQVEVVYSKLQLGRLALGYHGNDEQWIGIDSDFPAKIINSAIIGPPFCCSREAVTDTRVRVASDDIDMEGV